MVAAVADEEYASIGTSDIVANCSVDAAIVANILVHAAHLPGDTERGSRTGIRISVQEITRQGLEAADMRTIAKWMRRVGLERESPEPVAAEIVELLKEHGRILFCFDD